MNGTVVATLPGDVTSYTHTGVTRLNEPNIVLHETYAFAVAAITAVGIEQSEFTAEKLEVAANPEVKTATPTVVIANKDGV